MKKFMEKLNCLDHGVEVLHYLMKEAKKVENRFNIDLDGIDYDAKFVFEEIGYNLEGSEIGAAFGLVQLKNLKNNISVRAKTLNYNVNFSRHSDFFEIPLQKKGISTAWLAFPVLLKENAPFSRRDFQIYLEERGIQTRVVFTGNILRQPMCRGINKRVTKLGLQNADNVMKRGVLFTLTSWNDKICFKDLPSD